MTLNRPETLATKGRILRAPSGDTPEGYPVPHHILAKGREIQGPETPALADRRLRPRINLQQTKLCHIFPFWWLMLRVKL